MLNVPWEPLLQCSNSFNLLNDLGKFLATNAYAIAFIKNVLEGVSTLCAILSGAHKVTLRGVRTQIPQTHIVSLRYGIYMMHNAGANASTV